MSLPRKNEHLKRSRLQERKVADKYAGSVNNRSGAGWIKKADVRTETELVECKTTTKASFSLKAADLDKLWKQAILDNRIPVFEIDFANSGVTCVVLNVEDYKEMRNAV